MKIKARIFVAFTFAIFISNADAGAIAYNCEIRATYDLNNNGTLVLSPLQKDFFGKRFVVSRKTGQVIGDVLTTELALSKEVLRFGDKDWSFKTVARFKQAVQALDIQEFKKGEDKPFVAFSMDGGGIVAGICR